MLQATLLSDIKCAWFLSSTGTKNVLPCLVTKMTLPLTLTLVKNDDPELCSLVPRKSRTIHSISEISESWLSYCEAAVVQIHLYTTVDISDEPFMPPAQFLLSWTTASCGWENSPISQMMPSRMSASFDIVTHRTRLYLTCQGAPRASDIPTPT
jgi:hypothetical protein